MTLSLFDQFATPVFLGIPLLAIAMTAPWLLFQDSTNRWLPNRMMTLQTEFVRLFTKQVLYPLNIAGHKWASILTALMIFFITLNVLGLLPYTFTPTTQLSLNLGFAVPLWFAALTLGMRYQPTTSIGHLLPSGTPVPLIPALIAIETISLFIRPVAQGVRLTANLSAGHMLMGMISAGAIFILPLVPPAALLTTTLLLFFSLLELAVAVIQAYVFTLITALCLQENT